MGELWTAIGSVGTAIAVIVASVQIWYATRQEKTEFEDSLAKEYREILAQLPKSMLLQESEAARSVDEKTFAVLYRYIDLCNEQVFLWRKGRIRRDTWRDWCEGIGSNLRKNGIRETWEQIKRETNSFEELRDLETNNFNWRRRKFQKAKQT